MHLCALFYYKKSTLSTILEHSFLFIYFMLLFTPNSVTSNDYSHLKFTSHVHSTAYISCHCHMDMGHSDIPWLLHGALVHSVLTHVHVAVARNISSAVDV